MADYPFDLRGRQSNFEGIGHKDGEAYKSLEFTLTQGIVVAEIVHHGSGDFRLKFVPIEGLSKGQATVASLGGSFAAGAAIGSIFPGAGTIVGGLLGAGAGLFAGNAIGGVVGPTTWTPVEHRGEMDIFSIVRVQKDAEGCLPPGKYGLEVESESAWACRFIQPDLDQSFGPLIDEEDDDYKDDIPGGLYPMGPFTSCARPLLANIRHRGGGRFHAAAYSVDGTHECVLYEQEEGQFHVKNVQTEIRPGKEYMVVISADSKWSLTFTEGY